MRFKTALSKFSPWWPAEFQAELSALDDEVSAMANSVRKSLKGAPPGSSMLVSSLQPTELEVENTKAENEASAGAPDIRIRKTQHASLSRKFMQARRLLCSAACLIVAGHFKVQRAPGHHAPQAARRGQAPVSSRCVRVQLVVVRAEAAAVDPSIDDEDVDKILETGAEGLFSGKRVCCPTCCTGRDRARSWRRRRPR